MSLLAAGLYLGACSQDKKNEDDACSSEMVAEYNAIASYGGRPLSLQEISEFETKVAEFRNKYKDEKCRAEEVISGQETTIDVEGDSQTWLSRASSAKAEIHSKSLSRASSYASARSNPVTNTVEYPQLRFPGNPLAYEPNSQMPHPSKLFMEDLDRFNTLLDKYVAQKNYGEAICATESFKEKYHGVEFKNKTHSSIKTFNVNEHMDKTLEMIREMESLSH